MDSITRRILKEDTTKADTEKHINSYMDSSKFKDKIEKIVKEKLKSETSIEDKVVEITRNVLTQLFKTLYNKRGIWRNNLSNKSS